jgi:hypothetical protein
MPLESTQYFGEKDADNGVGKKAGSVRQLRGQSFILVICRLPSVYDGFLFLKELSQKTYL